MVTNAAEVILELLIVATFDTITQSCGRIQSLSIVLFNRVSLSIAKTMFSLVGKPFE